MTSLARDPGEELRLLKLSTSKGVAFLTACMLGMLAIFGTVFWLATGVAPTEEDSRNVFHETPERPTGPVPTPRGRGHQRSQHESAKGTGDET